MAEERLRRALPALVLVALSFAFRAPEIVHADMVNSDSAVVGLQAMHLLRGEWSPFLWGSGYQTSVDSMVAACWFALVGPSPRALVWSALSMHVTLTMVVFVMLKRRLPAWTAFVATLPLVFTTAAIHSYALYPPRQASLTLAFLALGAIDTAWFGARPLVWLLVGGALTALAPYADPYALLLVPLIAWYTLVVAWSLDRRRAALGSAALGAAIGLVPLLLLWRAPQAKHGVVTLSLDVIPKNARLLWEACLPWALGIKTYAPRAVMDYAPWPAPAAWTALAWTSAALVIALALGGAAWAWSSRLPWKTRALGLMGAAGIPLTLGAFVVSLMVMDHFSMRYLAAMLLLFPFALVSAASRLPRRLFVALLAPFLVTAGVSGWITFGPSVQGARIAPRTVSLDEDMALLAWLDARGIRAATADYWAAYRLTFLWRERVVVVPKNTGEDRYAAYRQGVEQAPRYAYLFDPLRSREDASRIGEDLAAHASGIEEHAVGRYRVWIVRR